MCESMKPRTDAGETLCEQANKKRKREDGHALVYMRPEDQFFHKVCKWSFQWKAKDSEGESTINCSCLVLHAPQKYSDCNFSKILFGLQIRMTSRFLSHFVFACWLTRVASQR